MTIDTRTLPPSVLPPNASPLEAALDIGFGKFLARIVPPFPELMNADETPADFLPYLAADRGVSEWKPSASEAEKRLTVALSWATKRQAGTRRALENAIKGLQLVPEITAWFEQTPKGTPYSFTVRAFSDQPYSEEINDRLDLRLADAKSERDTLSVSIGLRATGTHSIAGVTVCGETTTIYPLVLEGLEVRSPLYAGATAYAIETVTVYPSES
ncbi:phage tail protein I [Pseudomonas luteola]|uniref:phage tail protein I n=1 Tax=Pseudomonas luteola TaxID=47886 RepID=UPI001C612C07|nr:phage tail protein I [Pseudomonas zeshuii]